METIMKETLDKAFAPSLYIGEEIREGQEIGLLYNIVVFW